MTVISARKKGETLGAYRKRCERYVEKERKNAKSGKKNSSGKSGSFFVNSLIFVGVLNMIISGSVFFIAESYATPLPVAGWFAFVALCEALFGLVLRGAA
jgi:hypothetical protein